MTKLERRALLGIREAQEECTRKGILLQCPFCGGLENGNSGTIFKFNTSNLYAHKRTGKCVLDGMIIYNLSDWNTRKTPPVGRCNGCANWDRENQAGHKDLGNYVCACQEWSDPESGMTRFTGPEEFCSYFEPKGGEENAVD